MLIRSMTATFGKLQKAELTLSPGLNIICAPNESGKSTWSRFIRAMFYGVSTRERSEEADKNRYAPWSGAAMEGRMELSCPGGEYTVQRRTGRANAPMGSFVCTYTGTAEPVAGLTGQNFGETLLGIPAEVFERSAFIGQNALAVGQDAELEKRLAALITTGEETVSYSDTYERLKKQLNRRKHNRTGRIPVLETEIAALEGELSRRAAVQQQLEAARCQLTEDEARAEHWQTQCSLWERIGRQQQLEQYRAAEDAAHEAEQKLRWLTESAGPLPEDAALWQWEAQCENAARAQASTEEAWSHSRAAEDAAQRSRELWQQHPLYPAAPEELAAREEAMVPPSPPKRWPLLIIGIAALGLGGLAAGLLLPLLWPAITGGAVLLLSAVGLLLCVRRCRSIRAEIDRVRAGRELLHTQTEEYLPLRRHSMEADDAARRSRAAAEGLEQQQRRQLAGLLAALLPYENTAADLSGVRMALRSLRQKKDAIAHEARHLQELTLRRDLLRQHLPEGEVDMTPVTPPAVSAQEAEAALSGAKERLRSSRSRLDLLTGQLTACESEADLRCRLTQKQEAAQEAQREYDAIALAMETLTDANAELQSRFSPVLGRRAAEIMGRITAGRYKAVLLSRDFSVSAEAADDPNSRRLLSLSQGTADQLYLAVRLAICDLVLPEDRAVPLILDDALVSFDDERLAAALEYLVQEGEKRQILLFTCQGREREYLQGRENVSILSLSLDKP